MIHQNKRQKTINVPKAPELFGLECDHPFGVLPAGNALLVPQNEPVAKSQMGKTFLGLGDDERILVFLELLGPRLAIALGETCKALYVLSNHDELWRHWCLAEFKGNFKFSRSWRETYAFSKCELLEKAKIPISPIKIDRFFSDHLFHSWQCATVPLQDLVNPLEENIDRRSGLSMEDFLLQYGNPQKPVIITDCVQFWPAFQKWSLEYFSHRDRTREKEQLYRAEAVDISFPNYLQYMTQAKEESPLYLFDKFSLKSDPELARDFQVPCYFDQDLFQVLGKERPDYRWIIIGPERSGSTFHIDPNSTCAWNAVITGSKKWILTPPNQPPPGVYPSKDGSEVTSPVSLSEWYLNHYHHLKQLQSQGDITVYEAVCKPGEMIFVPAKYWHSVMNLNDGIAITQNFVSSYNLQQVLEFTKFKPEQVSGFCQADGSCQDLYQRFSTELQRQRPLDWEAVDHKRLQDRQTKTEWELLTGNLPSSSAPATTFTFDFGEEVEEEEEEDDVDAEAIEE